jgi:PAS domain S-box-containing protein
MQSDVGSSLKSTADPGASIEQSEHASITDLEGRVLVLAPHGPNAAVTIDILTSAGLAAFQCEDATSLQRELEAGCGVLLAIQEGVTAAVLAALKAHVGAQEWWSDLPVLILTQATAIESDAQEQELLGLGNVTLIQSPTRPATVVSAVRSALRSRERQYGQRVRFQAQALLAAIVESSDDAIISKRLDGHIVSWNHGAQRLFGYTADEAVGQPISLIIPPDRLHEEAMIIERLRRGERIEHYETVRLAKDGRHVAISLTISPIRDAGNTIVGASKVARDISQRRAVEQALRDADRRKDEFLATLAHELRNPLAPIRNSLHILRVTAISDPAVERVRDIMERQVNHMVRLVDDLLEISRITRGKIELRRERVEVAAVIGSAVETSKPLIDAAGQELIVSIPSEPLTLDADPVRLAQVFANLLNNASKYSDSGAQIWLTVRREGTQAVVSVRDTGIGIDAETLPRIFDMFAQGQDSLPRAQGGLGIGLTLVRSLVQLHSGKVDALSAGPGKGSEFVVRLDLAAPRIRDVRRMPEGRAASMPLRVLVVDDSRDGADSLAMMLSLEGADVRVAYDGQSALDGLVAFHPAAAILDLAMTDMDGYELARRIRAQPAHGDITLIALSGWGQEAQQRESQLAGFAYHLIKPPDADALRAVLASIAKRAPAGNAQR